MLRRLWMCSLFSGVAFGQEMREWERFEVFTHLRNDGAVDVTETLTALHRRVHVFASSDEEEIALAQRAARSELRKAAPQLEDAWLPQLYALGCGPDLARWRARVEADPASLRPEEAASSLRDADSGPPFTGRFSLDEELEWASLLSVPRGGLTGEADEEAHRPGQIS